MPDISELHNLTTGNFKKAIRICQDPNCLLRLPRHGQRSRTLNCCGSAATTLPEAPKVCKVAFRRLEDASDSRRRARVEPMLLNGDRKRLNADHHASAPKSPGRVPEDDAYSCAAALYRADFSNNDNKRSHSQQHCDPSHRRPVTV